MILCEPPSKGQGCWEEAKEPTVSLIGPTKYLIQLLEGIQYDIGMAHAAEVLSLLASNETDHAVQV